MKAWGVGEKMQGFFLFFEDRELGTGEHTGVGHREKAENKTSTK